MTSNTKRVFAQWWTIPEIHKPVLLQKLLFSPIGALKSRLANYKSFKRNIDNICAIPIAEKELYVLWKRNRTSAFQRVKNSAAIEIDIQRLIWSSKSVWTV